MLSHMEYMYVALYHNALIKFNAGPRINFFECSAIIEAFGSAIAATRRIYIGHRSRILRLYCFSRSRNQGTGQQYGFGDAFVVAPIMASADNKSSVTASIWVPSGTWLEWAHEIAPTLAVHHGPTTVSRGYTLDETPVLVKAGSIVAMRNGSADICRGFRGAWRWGSAGPRSSRCLDQLDVDTIDTKAAHSCDAHEDATR
jgi:hypothetical protein